MEIFTNLLCDLYQFTTTGCLQHENDGDEVRNQVKRFLTCGYRDVPPCDQPNYVSIDYTHNNNNHNNNDSTNKYKNNENADKELDGSEDGSVEHEAEVETEAEEKSEKVKEKGDESGSDSEEGSDGDDPFS